MSSEIARPVRATTARTRTHLKDASGRYLGEILLAADATEIAGALNGEWHRVALEQSESIVRLTAERDEAIRERDQWHALADERSQDVVNDAVLITSLKRDLGLLAADRDEWREAVMLCLAGLVGTPERGYVEDGGPKRAQGDALEMRRLVDRLREQVAAVPDDLRAQGWAVAVHNDYRQDGEPRTFWLFTHPHGRYAKGEGRTDAEALAQVRAIVGGAAEAGEGGGDGARP